VWRVIETTRASRLALWLAAAAEGIVSPDDVVDACGSLKVTNFDGDDESTSLALVAAFIARTPQTRVFLNLARPGDPGGWSTTADVTALAINQGAAIVIVPGDRILIPSHVSDTWECLHSPVSVHPCTDPIDIARLLKRTIRNVADQLSDLDVVAGRDQIDDDIVHHVQVPVPSDWDSTRTELLQTALRIDTVLTLADQHSGGAISASSQVARSQSLSDLKAMTRRAIEAASSSHPYAPMA
jgi:hypothetical protein